MSIGEAQTAAAICFGVFQHDISDWQNSSGHTELYATIGEIAVFTEALYNSYADGDANGVFDYDVAEELGHFIGGLIERRAFDCYSSRIEIDARATQLVDAFFGKTAALPRHTEAPIKSGVNVIVNNNLDSNLDRS